MYVCIVFIDVLIYSAASVFIKLLYFTLLYLDCKFDSNYWHLTTLWY